MAATPSTSVAEPRAVDLPRTQVGSPPQHLMVTLLADYSLRHRNRLPSAALVELTCEFGISEVGARAALSRLSRRGVIEASKEGRRTYYRLTRDAAAVLARGSRRIAAFAQDAENWDGEWTVVAFSLPEERRDTRHLLRSRLRWQGFAPLYDGLWVSPRATPEEVRTTMNELDVDSATVLRARQALAGGCFRAPIEAWDLANIAEAYQEFVDRWSPVGRALRTGGLSSSDALVARTQIMDTYRRFPGMDPQLPLRLMPTGWPREAARRLFTEAYDWLGPLATSRVRKVVAETAPELVAEVEHHSTAELVAGSGAFGFGAAAR